MEKLEELGEDDHQLNPVLSAEGAAEGTGESEEEPGDLSKDRILSPFSRCAFGPSPSSTCLATVEAYPSVENEVLPQQV